MGIPVWIPGQVLTASDVNSWFVPLAAYKPSDQQKTSTTTLGNDNDLVLAMAANAIYYMTAFITYKGTTLGNSDIKIGWTVPASTTMSWGHLAIPTTGTAPIEGSFVNSDQTNVPSMGTDGTGNPLNMYLFGTVDTAGTAGNLQLQWAQNTSNATATTVRAGSTLLLWRIA